tara:strand:+ start:375 stop:1193 length:819 start_codon:yes stop_codon:yes gene_type:complete
MSKKLTLLIDADILIFQVAAKVQTSIEWEEGEWTTHASMPEAIALFDQRIEEMVQRFNATDVKLALTDSQGNFRKKVLPTYKANRSGAPKPMLLVPMINHVRNNRDGVWVAGLEGDDVMGILATSPKTGPNIIVSIDKDMGTIPCQLFAHGKNDGNVIEVTEEAADRMHMIQTLAGDSTDGYAGCPGVGIITATRIVDDPVEMIPHETTKGEVWKKGDPCDVWTAVVSQYHKAGLTEEKAIQQARVARICRYSDFNTKTKEVILWSPAQEIR